MPLERTPERSKRVAIGDFMLAVVLAVVGEVTGIWFAYIAAAAALLFAAFVWVRASLEINGRGGLSVAYGPVRQSTASASTSGAARSSGSAT
ncbi:MAG: hypothetical protein WBE95_07380 [Trebonia sp.]|uniref:hypothetical protein n=1 Tax=Trebonia sp. TaxID=2767075 RepID=UPI003C7142FA